MGVGFALNPRLRYCVSLHTPHSFTNSPLCLSSPSVQLESGKLVSTPRGYLCPQHFMRREKFCKIRIFVICLGNLGK
ncbi:hypothetical protein JHK82_039845 [Glycine max]|nr:hypothetical protein JHK86_040043 [Glycine max]KAG4965645.1 hypothetical protein JHK85_040620 [Glycine max]KAG5110622.1 hypothetical protein JHK82_039845 [Glycine max]